MDAVAGPIDKKYEVATQAIRTIGASGEVRVSDVTFSRIVDSTVHALKQILNLKNYMRSIATPPLPPLKADDSWKPIMVESVNITADHLAGQAAATFLLDLDPETRDGLVLEADKLAAIHTFEHQMKSWRPSTLSRKPLLTFQKIR